ncbi:MAG: hypothetical protein WC714_29500 [Candidatus Obscuribacterales bacterium]
MHFEDVLKTLDDDSIGFDLFLEDLLNIFDKLNSLEQVIVRKRIGLFDGTFHHHDVLELEEQISRDEILLIEKKVLSLMRSARSRTFVNPFDQFGLRIIQVVRRLSQYPEIDREIFLTKYGLVDGIAKNDRDLVQQFGVSLTTIRFWENCIFESDITPPREQ